MWIYSYSQTKEKGKEDNKPGVRLESPWQWNRSGYLVLIPWRTVVLIWPARPIAASDIATREH